MNEIIMRNAAGEQINVNVIRFFRLNGIEYLIFSLNEVDEGGYVKLYVSKIVEQTGKTIEDDVEWNLIKDTIKTIIKSNKDNLPLPITDLDVTRINNLQILDQKIFKLNDSLLQLLTANKKEEIIATPNIEIESQETIENVVPREEIQPTLGVVPEQQPIDIPNAFSTYSFENSNSMLDSNSSSENLKSNYVLENTNDQSTEYALDYKTLYDNELNKNEELTKEVEKYKNIINSLKNILSENN